MTGKTTKGTNRVVQFSAGNQIRQLLENCIYVLTRNSELQF